MGLAIILVIAVVGLNIGKIILTHNYQSIVLKKLALKCQKLEHMCKKMIFWIIVGILSRYAKCTMDNGGEELNLPDYTKLVSANKSETCG